MKENSVVTTKVGNFEYAQMGKGIVVYLNNGANVFLQANWWDKDEVRNVIESNIGLINKRIAAKSQTKVTINSIKDASNILQEVNEYVKVQLDGKEKGFVTSRLTQIINKLNEVKQD